MPWLAQYADLPDAHKHWADPGSALEAVFARLGYVEVPAPGADEVDDELVLDEQEPEQVDEPDEDDSALREE